MRCAHNFNSFRHRFQGSLYQIPVVHYFQFWLISFTWIHFHWSPNSSSSWLMCFRIVTLLTFYSIYISLGRDLIDPFPKSFPPPRPYISSPQKWDGTVTHWQLTSFSKVQSSKLINFEPWAEFWAVKYDTSIIGWIWKRALSLVFCLLNVKPNSLTTTCTTIYDTSWLSRDV